SVLDRDVGLIRTCIREQQIPAAILFFSVFAGLLWRLRYVLPFASAAGVLGREDIDPELRPLYEDAQALTGEARRLMAAHRKDYRAAVAEADRDKLEAAVDDLEAILDGETIDGKKLSKATDVLQGLVDKHLGPWRKSELREFSESIFFALGVAIVLRVFVIEAFKIPSGSMIPTLAIGDHIFVAKYAYGPLLPFTKSRLYDALPPERGDVMVFKYPENEDQDYIKRTIALPGDKLEVLSGRPVINGWAVPNCYVGEVSTNGDTPLHLYVEYLGDTAYIAQFRDPLPDTQCKVDSECGDIEVCRGGICGSLEGPYQVRANEVWVLGDNRDNSSDSRAWNGNRGGGVPFANIKGRALFVWMSMDPEASANRWYRMFVNVMGEPTLPPETSPELIEKLTRCFEDRPSLTLPPATSALP
ncbi:MAG: signal peptidase I, partial [Myxococcota bacterium]